jgi:hypothetical protein
MHGDNSIKGDYGTVTGSHRIRHQPPTYAILGHVQLGSNSSGCSEEPSWKVYLGPK